MRVYLRRAPRGLRLVRGGQVIELQIGLEFLGFGRGGIDGIFGSQTESAVQAWQMSRRTNPDGWVDATVWRGVTRQDPPSLFRRCLSVTAAFEGHGYTHAAGNWDNAYLTWGIVGFTLRHGNLGEIVRRAEARHPGLMAQVIGHEKSDELMRIINSNSSTRRRWANHISRPPGRYKIQPDWADAFEMLGQRAELRTIQDEVARDVYWVKAVEDFRRFGLSDECDLALCFDTAVQNGGIDNEKAGLIAQGMAAAPGATGETRRSIMANAIADGSDPRYSEDVRSRRMTLATGAGAVHGAGYRIDLWGLEPYPVEPLDLA